MADLVRAEAGVDGVAVGDRPDTDGRFARALGYRFGLVLTGSPPPPTSRGPGPGRHRRRSGQPGRAVDRRTVVSARRRLDDELVRRRLAPSRNQAQADIAAGRVPRRRLHGRQAGPPRAAQRRHRGADPRSTVRQPGRGQARRRARPLRDRRGGPARPRCRRVDGWVHATACSSGARPRGRRRRGPRPAPRAAPSDRGCASSTAPTSASSIPAGRRPRRPRGRRPVLHLAAPGRSPAVGLVGPAAISSCVKPQFEAGRRSWPRGGGSSDPRSGGGAESVMSATDDRQPP